ncbi:MAG: hypothetical protein ACXW3N_12185 [Rhodoplanes sp.]
MNGAPAGVCLEFAEFEQEAQQAMDEELPRPLIRDLPPADPYLRRDNQDGNGASIRMRRCCRVRDAGRA